MKELFKNNTKIILLVIVAVIGVMIICFSDSLKTNSNSAGKNPTELEQYTENLEERLTSVIRGIDGAGETKVMITFESTFEKVYANNARLEESGSGENSNLGKSSEKEIVLAGRGTSGEAPVLLKELCPKVKGVVVVCEGAKNANVEAKIKEAVTSLFGISELKVCVTKGVG